jgi:hypothetical protein
VLSFRTRSLCLLLKSQVFYGTCPTSGGLCGVGDACRPAVVLPEHSRVRAVGLWRRMPQHRRGSVSGCWRLLRRASAQFVRRVHCLAGLLLVCMCLAVAGLINTDLPVSVTAVPTVGMGDAVSTARTDPSTPVRTDGRFE